MPTANSRTEVVSNVYFIAPDDVDYLDTASDCIVAGNDTTGSGTEAAPWATWTKAQTVMAAGDTLYMLGGTYFWGSANVSWTKAGTSGSRITVGVFPGDIAVINMGYKVFYDDPANAWEPAPSPAVAGEYRSILGGLSNDGDFSGIFNDSSRDIGGHFGDSYVPFFKYIRMEDLRSSNQYWYAGLGNNNSAAGSYPDGNSHPSLYAGPGCMYYHSTRTDPINGGSGDGRIHIRLAHTNITQISDNDYLGRGVLDNNYTGETDPRNLELIIPTRSEMQLRGSYVTYQDFVVIGGKDVQFGNSGQTDTGLIADGLHIYTNRAPLGIQMMGNAVTLTSCKLRGNQAPWSNRFADKNRSSHTTLMQVRSLDATIENCEFSDQHNGVTFNTVVGDLTWRKNALLYCNDDALFLPARHASRVLEITESYFGGCTSCLPFAGGGFADQPNNIPITQNSTSVGAYICRNLFDMRVPIYQTPPDITDPENDEVFGYPLLTNEHSTSVRPDIRFYHNTTLHLGNSSAANNLAYYMGRWGRGYEHAVFRIYNNIHLQVDDQPKQTVSTEGGTFDSRNNLAWGINDGSLGSRPGDIHDDPDFTSVTTDWGDGTDVRLEATSPAIDAGYDIATNFPTWPDPWRDSGDGTNDIGAVPVGFEQDQPFGPNGFTLPTGGSPNTVPDQPSDLSAALISASRIDLAWIDNASDETAYKVERAADGGAFAELSGAEAADSTSYSDTTVAADTSYQYRVRCSNANGNSIYSNTATQATLPAAPSALTATAVGADRVDLAWTDNSSLSPTFKIERESPTGGGFAEIATQIAGQTTYSDTGLSASTEYNYRVRASTSDGNSAYSTATSDTTEGGASPMIPSALAVPTTGTTSANSIATGSLSPTGNALLVVFLGARSGVTTTMSSPAVADTFTGTGAWSVHQLAQTGGASHSTHLYVATAQAGSSPGTGTITASWSLSSGSTTRRVLAPLEVTGFNTAAPVTQSNKNSGTGATLTVTLSGSPVSTSLVLGAVASVNASGADPSSVDFTELSDTSAGAAPELTLEIMYDSADADTTAEWESLGSQSEGAAVEIAVTTGGGAATAVVRGTRFPMGLKLGLGGR